MDRRKSPRYTVTQAFSLQFDRERIVHARGVDLSRGGLRCMALEPIDFSASVFVMLRFEADGKTNDISVEAQVVRCEATDSGEYDVALEFVTLYAGSAEKLDAYLRAVATG